MSKSQKQFKNKECSKGDLEQSSKRNAAGYATDIWIQIIAWLLLTVGLCIIITVFYMALRQNSNENQNVINETGLSNAVEFDSSDEMDEGHDSYVSRTLERAYVSEGIVLPIKQGCTEISCRIICSGNDNIYKDTAALMSTSTCNVATDFVLVNQNRHCIEDQWSISNRTVLKIILTKSKLGKIRSSAFNTEMFARVFHMSWIDLELDEVNSGALLGLYSLEKLEIDSKLPALSIAFLQPVQTTLVHLRLNAGIILRSDSSLFENIFFNKLQYLDLSHNTFTGLRGINKRLFVGTPHLTSLYLDDCSITFIEDDAFEDIGQNLLILSLAQNQITTISANVLSHLNADSRFLLELEPNNWNCSCEVRPLVEFYTADSSQFLSPLYCRMPNDLFGKNFDELDVQELGCEEEHESELPFDEEMNIDPSAPTTTTKGTKQTTNDIQDDTDMKTTPETSTSRDYVITGEDIPTIINSTMQLGCSETVSVSSSEDEPHTRESRALNMFSYEVPKYDLVLELNEDFTVLASIEGYVSSDELKIMWFTEHFDNDIHGKETSQLDYNCMQYEDPFVLISALTQNHTYTFCMMAQNEVAISPLNCQPLHVPLQKSTSSNDEVWIAESEKRFTIAMICLILTMSTFFGAIIAYLGIKTYPDLLEGSKNVMVIKESDKTCYVSTITESEYMGTKPTLYSSNKRLPETPGAPNAKSPSRLTSIQSGSTFLNDSFSNMQFQDDEYELPKQFNYLINERCESNDYATSPNCPPPLPKRNSNVSIVLASKEQ